MAATAIPSAAPSSITETTDRRERLGLAITVRVILVRRPGRDVQPAPDDERREEVGRRLDRVGDQGVGMPHDPGHELDRDEQQIHDQPRQGGTLTSRDGDRSRFLRPGFAHCWVHGHISSRGPRSATTAGQRS